MFAEIAEESVLFKWFKFTTTTAASSTTTATSVRDTNCCGLHQMKQKCFCCGCS